MALNEEDDEELTTVAITHTKLHVCTNDLSNSC